MEVFRQVLDWEIDPLFIRTVTPFILIIKGKEAEKI